MNDMWPGMTAKQSALKIGDINQSYSALFWFEFDIMGSLKIS